MRAIAVGIAFAVSVAEHIFAQHPHMDLAFITQIVYIEGWAPDSLFKELEEQQGTSSESTFLRAYSAVQRGEYALAHEVNALYKKLFEEDARSCLIDFLILKFRDDVIDRPLLDRAMLLASAPANEFLSYEFFHALKDLDRSMALAHLDSALSSNPGFLLAALTRAYEYDQRQDCEEIIHLLERFKKETNDADLLLYLGSAYHHCGAVESARACYWKAINAQPNSEGYAALATIAQDVDKDNQMSESLFLRSLELEENCNVRLDLGWLYYKQGKHVMARTQFALCAERDKCCGSAIEALMLIGEWSLAERYYPSMSYCEHPEYILIALGIAIRVKSEGRSAQTIQDLIRDYENLYSNQPDESEALSFLREVLEQFGL